MLPLLAVEKSSLLSTHSLLLLSGWADVHGRAFGEVADMVVVVSILELGGCRFDSGGLRLEAGCWRLKAGGWLLEASWWRLHVGCWVWRLEAGGSRLGGEVWGLEAGGCTVEAGGWRLEAGCLGLGLECRCLMCELWCLNLDITVRICSALS